MAVSNRGLLIASCVLAALPPLSLLNDGNWSHQIGEAVFFALLGVAVPALWLIASLKYFRRQPPPRPRWIFVLAPLAFGYPLGVLILGIAVLLKPGRW